MHLDEDVYLKSMVAATADGASVNFGIYQGVLTQLKTARPWLLTVHCVSHRVELVVKDAMKMKPFEEVDQFYQANKALLERSSDLRASLLHAAAVMNITCYSLPKNNRDKIYTTTDVATKLKEILTERFSEFSSQLCQNMKWLDPKNWLYDGKEPLEGKGFLLKDALSEWKCIKRIVSKLSTSKEVLEDRIVISANDKNWLDTEGQEITEVAIDAYMKKRCVKQTEVSEPQD
eukprot:gene15033-6194_t